MNKAVELVEKAGTYYLATVEDDQPRVRPFGTINEYNEKVYIQTGLVKDVAKQLLKNPKAEICAFTGGAWVRIAGKLILDEDIEAQKSMLEKYPNLGNMYKPGDGNTAVFYFEDATATISSFTPSARVHPPLLRARALKCLW